MFGGQSLQDVLNVVASGATSGSISQNSGKQTIEAPKKIGEFEAFSALDPLLADLQKQYLDAKAQRVQAVREFGADDAMSDMAAWAEDSAWCAVQTRYMELRSDRALMREAQAMMRESEEEERAAMEKAREKESLKNVLYLQMTARMHEARKNDNFGWWALLYLLAMQQQDPLSQYYPAYQFNRMAA